MMDDTRLPERFWVKVSPEPNTGCWLWMAAVDRDGYAAYEVGTKQIARAHRYAYLTLVGPVPIGLVLDHLCRVKACVNPAHLEPVTTGENTRRYRPYRQPQPLVGFAAANSQKTHCPAGHPYSGENLYLHRGKRRCRICSRLPVRTG